MARIGAMVNSLPMSGPAWERFVKGMRHAQKLLKRFKARVKPFREPLPSEEAK